MFDIALPPSLILIIGAVLLPLLPQLWHRGWALLLPTVTMAVIWQIPADVEQFMHFAGFDILPMTLHPFTRIFATAFALAAFLGALFGAGRMNNKELAACLFYAGCAIGVTFAGDFITLFIHWELMAIASTVIILHGGTEHARTAAFRYALMHFFGGALLLASITAHFEATGSILLIPFSVEWSDWLLVADPGLERIAAWAILIAIGINLAAPPFSSWLSDAYPAASPFGSVFLSAFTTKTAVFALLTLFAGKNLLIYIGLFMVFYGIIYAMLENNIRRILSFSIINQVGFMVVGIGIGTDLALYGVAAHAFCHIMYKGLLFMSAGSVVYMTGKHTCLEVGGLYRTMRITCACGIVGALAISAFPLTSGFISKSMIASAAGDEQLFFVWVALLAASAGVFLHAGIKFPWFVFFHRDSGLRPQDPPTSMKLAMIFTAIICILPGIFPQIIYAMLPPLETALDYQPYTPAHITSQLQLLLFGGLAFFLFIRYSSLLERKPTLSLTFDWLYRHNLKWLFLMLVKAGFGLVGGLKAWGLYFFRRLRATIYHYHGPRAILARNWEIGHTVLYAAGLLGLFLIVYYYSG